MTAAIPCRLFFIMARQAPLAVIFRRGPSKWVQIIKWATKTDAFEPGQWFHGRISERCADLSPDGKLMIYVASKYRRGQYHPSYTEHWTAVSKPPWLTALALWPGTCTGGLFRDNRTVLLPHLYAKVHPDQDPGAHLRVWIEPPENGDWSPENAPRQRDGWVRESEGHWTQVGLRPPRADPPDVWSRPHPSKPWQLVRRLHGCRQQAGPVIRSYIEDFALRRQDRALEVPLPDVDWAEWDHRGRLVFARAGCILTASINDAGHLAEAVLADFTAARPVSMPPPKEALVW